MGTKWGVEGRKRHILGIYRSTRTFQEKRLDRLPCLTAFVRDIICVCLLFNLLIVKFIKARITSQYPA